MDGADGPRSTRGGCKAGWSRINSGAGFGGLWGLRAAAPKCTIPKRADRKWVYVPETASLGTPIRLQRDYLAPHVGFATLGPTRRSSCRHCPRSRRFPGLSLTRCSPPIRCGNGRGRTTRRLHPSAERAGGRSACGASCDWRHVLREQAAKDDRRSVCVHSRVDRGEPWSGSLGFTPPIS